MTHYVQLKELRFCSGDNGALAVLRIYIHNPVAFQRGGEENNVVSAIQKWGQLIENYMESSHEYENVPYSCQLRNNKFEQTNIRHRIIYSIGLHYFGCNCAL